MAREKALRIIPLGGLGEVGKNMMAYEYGKNILVVDAGIMFPENDMLGVNYIIPDFQYLIDHSENVIGMVITHGHEDHIGAVPHVLEALNIPIYTTPLTKGLIEGKLARNGKTSKVTIEEVQAGDKINLGPFQVEFFHVSHSIPDAVGLGITTPAGLIVHTGDYKFDHTPADNWPTDFAKLAELANRGVDILLADSTNSERPGWTPSEKVIEPAINEIFSKAPGRVIIATFASLISRMQQVSDAATRNNRKLAFVGTSMVDNSKIAMRMGYINIPSETLITLDEALNLPSHKVVLMCTGTQGEPSSIIGRLSTSSNRQFDILPDDTIILSSHPIPGNEEAVGRTINRLLRRGARIIHDGILPVHVSGHASQEEQKLLINLIRPKNLIPIHGELRMLKRHADIAEEMGIPAKNIHVIENGQVVELRNGQISLAERIPGKYIFVEGSSIGDVDMELVREREKMARGGILLVDISVDKYSNRLINDPEIITRGFLSQDDADSILPALKERIKYIVDTTGIDNEKVIVDSLRTYLYQETKRRPMVFVTLTRI